MRNRSMLVLIIAFVLLAIFVMGGAYYFGKSLSKNPQIQNSTVKPSVVDPSPSIVPSASVDTSNFKTYTDSKNSFSLKYSTEWVAEAPKGKEDSTSLVLKNKDQTVISVVVNPTNQSLDELATKGFSPKDIVGRKKINLDSVAAEEITTQYQNSGQITVTAIKNGKAYQIIAPLKNKETTQRDLDQILSTFKFTDK